MLFGAGAQAETQLAAISYVRELEQAKVFDIDRNRAVEFGERMSRILGIPVQAVDNPETAVRNSDIITCATTSQTPVLKGQWLTDGTHINGIGSFTPST